MRYTKRTLSTLAAALVLAACAPAPLQPSTQPANQVPNQQQAVGVKLGAYTFNALSAEAAAQLASRNAAGESAAGASAPTAAPMAAGASAGAKMSADAAMSIAPGSPYRHGTFFSGPYGPMKLESATEAKGPGNGGTWADIKAAVVAPVLADWAADGRLIATYGTIDGQGATAQGEGLGWHATYASASKNEVLEFHVQASGTTITRLKWAPQQLDFDGASVDAQTALAAVTAAIGDQGFKSEEEKTGKDYFFGTDMNAGGGMVGIALAKPASAPRPAVDVAVDPVAPVPPDQPIAMPSPKILYQLKAGGRWNVSLQAIEDKVVWDYWYDPVTYPAYDEKADWQEDPSASAMVDAKTGAIVRLRRPQMYPTYRNDVAVASPPQPMPATAAQEKQP